MQTVVYSIHAIKWGIKVWVCADAVTGYVHTFEIYTGADDIHSKHPKGVTYSIVMHLLEHLLENLFEKGHIVYMDNFYTSPILFADLLEKTTASGTVKVSRTNFLKSIKPTSKVSRANLCITNQIPTATGDAVVQVPRRIESDVVDVTCPEIIQDYNSFMGGVDICDHYSVGRKSMKWWRRIFWGLHDIAIINAYIIYKYNNRTSLKQLLTPKQFRLEIAKELYS